MWSNLLSVINSESSEELNKWEFSIQNPCYRDRFLGIGIVNSLLAKTHESPIKEAIIVVTDDAHTSAEYEVKPVPSEEIDKMSNQDKAELNATMMKTFHYFNEAIPRLLAKGRPSFGLNERRYFLLEVKDSINKTFEAIESQFGINREESEKILKCYDNPSRKRVTVVEFAQDSFKDTFIFTNKVTDEIYDYLTEKTIESFPDYDKSHEELMKRYHSIQDLLDYANTLFDYKTFYEKEFESKVRLFSTEFFGRNKRVAESNLRDSVNNLENLRTRYRECLQQVEEQKTLVEMYSRKGAESLISDFIDMLKKSKLIESIPKVSDSKIYFTVHAPLIDFDPEDYQSLVYHDEESDVCESAWEMNSNIDWYRLRRMTDRFFDEETYELYLDTSVYVGLDGSFGRGLQCSFGNPHITGYNCFGNNEYNISEAFGKLDLVLGFTLLMNAMKNINFTDMVVADSFFKELVNMIDHDTVPRCKNKETGEWCTVKELYLKED